MEPGILLLHFLLILPGFVQGQPEREATPFWKPLEITVVAAITREEIESFPDLYVDTNYTYDYLIDSYDLSGSFGLELWSIVWEKLKLTIRFITPQGVSANIASALPQIVNQGGANFAVVPTVFGPEDVKGLTLTQPTHSTRFKLFVQSPTSVSTSLSLGKVFTPVLWLATVVSMLMMGVILIFIEFVGQKAKIRSYLATPADIGQLIIIIIGCFCYQGAIQIASGCSGRVLVWTSLICGYLIYVSFNTEVISQLTTVSFKPPFESLEDMVVKGTHKLIVRNETSLLDNIKITRIKDGKRGPLADIWDQLLPMKPKAENLYNDKKEIPRLCKEKVAFLDSELAIPPRDQQVFKCNVMTLKDSYFRSNLGFVLNQNNTFNRQVIKLFNRMRETGIINRMRRNIDQPDVGPLKPLPDLNPIEIQTLIPMLVVLYVGMFASLVTLGLEIAFNRGGAELIRRLEERGFYSWKDVVCFWKVKRKMEEESSSEDEEDTDVEQQAKEALTVPTIKIGNTPQSPVKVRSVGESKKIPVKSTSIKNEENRSGFLAPPLMKRPHKFEDLHNYVNQQLSQREERQPPPLQRRNRVADLTSILPKPINASTYLDKNLVHGHDSSQESNNFESPPPDVIRSAPNRRPEPERSPKPPDRQRRDVTPAKEEPKEIPRNIPAAAPRYDPQEMVRQKPSREELLNKPASTPPPEPRRNRAAPPVATPAPDGVERPRFSPQNINRQRPAREEVLNQPPEPRRIRATRPIERPNSNEVEKPRVNPEGIIRQRPSREMQDKPSAPEQSPELRRNRVARPVERPVSEAVEQPRRNARENRSAQNGQVDLLPIDLNQLALQRRENHINMPQNNRNLHLSIDTDGFLDRHSIIDQNLARRMRRNRDPDPFGGLE